MNEVDEKALFALLPKQHSVSAKRCSRMTSSAVSDDYRNIECSLHQQYVTSYYTSRQQKSPQAIFPRVHCSNVLREKCSSRSCCKFPPVCHIKQRTRQIVYLTRRDSLQQKPFAAMAPRSRNSRNKRSAMYVLLWPASVSR